MKQNFRINLIKSLAVTFLLIFTACSSDDSDDGTTDPVMPTASFTVVMSELQATFTNTSQNATSYSWDFGDGNTSTAKDPVHTYATAGNFTVKLTATNAEGNNETSSSVTAEQGTISTPPDPNNLIAGGGFEGGDVDAWTVFKVGQPNLVSYELGYEIYKPAGGSDGALYIAPDNLTSDDGEAAFIHQKITVTQDGEYEIGALVKLQGENQADPATAMTDYWFQVYIGTEEPQDLEFSDEVNDDGSPKQYDYTDGQVSGWFFGAWTGWGYEIPATDGALVHDYLASNIASSEGRLNLSPGDYYVGIKVGKAGAGSFGEGIAVDDFYLTRVGDRNPCFDWDGTQEGNLIKGGQFEECDDKYWTLLKADAGLPEAEGIFGYTDYAPAGGDGGAFYTPGDVESSSSTLYQYIGNLEAGTYQLDALVKLGGVESGMSQYWWEILVYTEEPEFEVGYSPKDAEDNAIPRVAGYIHAPWGGGVDAVAYDGELQYDYTNGNSAGADGTFTLDASGDYFFVLKWGTFEGSMGDGIAVDNLSLVKVD
ncbi:MAG: PKD domain-containing protein [Bacteroidota bacterium]